MQCANCGAIASHLRITSRGETCDSCGGFTATGGVATDNTETRNSFRIRHQQKEYETDFTTSHIYDKTTKRAVVNPDFVERFPGTAHLNYSPKELKAAGYGELAEQVKNRRKPQTDTGVKFKGNTKEAIKRAIKPS